MQQARRDDLSRGKKRKEKQKQILWVMYVVTGVERQYRKKKRNRKKRDNYHRPHFPSIIVSKGTHHPKKGGDGNGFLNSVHEKRSGRVEERDVSKRRRKFKRQRFEGGKVR